ncbi:MAG: hypothetical protein KDB14_14485 [Planctomycetales bacterium]|nr:hypothetical protein [Planctomycetales bacterium]
MEKSNWRRHFLGSCSIVLLAAAAWLLMGNGGASDMAVAGGCMRIGLVLAAVWLAWPQISEITYRVPAWVGWTLLVSFVLIVARPRTIVFVGPLLLALLALHWMGFLLKPKRPKPASSRQQLSLHDPEQQRLATESIREERPGPASEAGNPYQPPLS